MLEIVAGHGVGVVPASARGTCGEGEAAAIEPLHHRRALFVSAIDFGRDVEAVPVDHLRPAGFVDHVDDYGLALGHSQRGSGNPTVVRQRLDGVAAADIGIDFTDAQRDVGGGIGREASRRRRRMRLPKPASAGE